MNRILKRKGFTLVELIVVMAIVGIMLGLIISSMNDKSGEKSSADARAKDILSISQALFTTYELSEEPVSTYLPVETTYISYDATERKNSITAGTYMFVEIACEREVLTGVRISSTLADLCKTGSTNFATGTTTLEQAMLRDLNARVASVNSGFYYILVDSGFKVIASHYTKNAYRYSNHNDTIFTDSGMSNDVIVGTCVTKNYTIDFSTKPSNELGYLGSYFFDVADDELNTALAFYYIVS